MREKQIKFSIITPCFNSEKTIKRTIENVINQTYQYFEYIIIDGGSTDNTVDIIKSYQEAYPEKIKFISEKDNGIYDAMNKGIKMASGDIVGIVNSDDYYELNALEIINNNIEKISEYTIIYGMIRSIKNGKEYMVYGKNYEFIPEQMLTHPSCFVTKKVYDDFGMYSLDYKLASDYEFMLRMYYNKQIKFIELYDIISNFSVGGSSYSAKNIYETARVRKKFNAISKSEYRFQILKYIFYSIKLKLKHK